MKTLTLSFLVSSLFVSHAFASILPENSLQIPLGITETGLTEEQYHRAIDRVEAIYRPEIEAMGIKLTVNRLWEDPTVNAGTLQNKKEWVVNLYGGYARHELITEDSYMMVFCHELGHHLGGHPRKIFSSTKLPGWPSSEGQSDYFASTKCLRRVFEKENNAEVIANMDIPKSVWRKCYNTFNTKEEVNICMRTAMAGLATAKIASTAKKIDFPSLDKMDLNEVEKNYDAHPAPQCRLDTYFQGALCDVSHTIPFSKNEELQGSCHAENGHKEGLRPRCWFKPSIVSEVTTE